MALPSSHKVCWLEDVPVAVKIQIMKSLTEVTSLRSLALASKPFYTVYTMDGRQRIYQQVVMSELTPALWLDASMVWESENTDFPDCEEGDAELSAFFQRCDERLRSPNVTLDRLSSFGPKELPQDFEGLSIFHHTQARIRRLVDEVLSFQPRYDENQPPLSDSERLRIYRAMCHVQTFSNLFGPESQLAKWWRLPWDYEDLNELIDRFMKCFLPWEIAAMLFFSWHLTQRWRLTIQKLADTASMVSSDRQGPDILEGAKIKRDYNAWLSSVDCRHYINSIAYLTNFGPVHLDRFLCKNQPGQYEELRALQLNPLFQELAIEAYDFRSSNAPRLPAASSFYKDDDSIQTKLEKLCPRDRPSDAWLSSALDHKIPSGSLGPATYESLLVMGRDWRLLFWDVERLKSWGIDGFWEGIATRYS